MNAPYVRSARRVSLLALLACAGCGPNFFQSGGDDDVDVLPTPHAADPGAEPVVRGRWIVYFASEAGTGTGLGTDLNGDLVPDDTVAVVVDVLDEEVHVLGVAARRAAIVDDEVYLVVDEALDGTDFGGDPGAVDVVLLHWSEDAGVLAFVDELDADAGDVASERELLAVRGDFLFYTASAPVLAGDETALRFVDVDADPLLGAPVLNQVGAGPLRPRLLGQDAGLVLLFLDESVEGATRNGDADLDDLVLALLDVRDDDVPRVANVGLALAGGPAEGAPVDVSDLPFAAVATDVDDWLVGFLVSEAAEGGVNRNDPALFAGVPSWQPPQCVTADADAEDFVLAYVEYADWLADLTAPVSTGLAGHARVLVVDGFVGTLAGEAESACDFDEDGTSTDSVVRWMGVGDPLVAPAAATELRAVAELDDDSRGVAAFAGRFVCVIDEATDGPGGTDHDGDCTTDSDLLAALDPESETVWTTLHETPSNQGSPIPFYAGVAWMAERPASGFLAIAFQESVIQIAALPQGEDCIEKCDCAAETRNFTCDGTHDDEDTLDTIPVWTVFDGQGDLVLGGVGFALEPGDPSFVLAGSRVFFRVSEGAHEDDLNGDGDDDDVLLLFNPMLACDPELAGFASLAPGPAAFTDGSSAVGFFADEGLAGTDLNGDGDTVPGELVLMYFEL